MDEDLRQYVRETPWPEVRDRIRSTARAGGMHNLESAASLGTLADHFAIMPEQERVLDEVWDALRYAHHPASWLAPRLLKPERLDRPLDHYGLPHPEWSEPIFDTRMPRGVDQIEGPFPIDAERVRLTPLWDRALPYTYAAACFLTPPGEPIGRETIQLMVRAIIPMTPVLHGCTGAHACRVHPDDLIRRFTNQAIVYPVPGAIGYAGSRLLVWRALSILTGSDTHVSFAEVARSVRVDCWVDIKPLMERVYWPDRVNNCYAHVNESRGETMMMMWDEGSY
ncbi:MAG: hypothetical protein KF902_14035 [Phycisphaeraceae bacterium]|nr:hypothetical protein [Phycisphaeraceae bacterium]